MSFAELHAKLTKHVLRAGVGEKSWNKLLHFRDESKKEKAYEFLKELEKNQWKAVDDLWNAFCATDEMWDNMDTIFDGVEFPEKVKLDNLLKKLKERWVRFRHEIWIDEDDTVPTDGKGN